jgi:hypothetical protein
VRGITTRIAAIAAAVCGLLALAGAPALASPDGGQAQHVVIAGVAGLRWSDVSAQRTPTLARLARSGSAGTLSVRAAPSVTCPGEGWLTLGAGTYAALEDPAGTEESAGCGHRGPPSVRSAGAGAQVPDMPELVTLNESLRFGAEPGLLGGSGLRCSTAIGPGAALAVADPAGRVGRYEQRLPADPRALLAECPLTAVDLGSLPATGAARARALRDMDEALARIDSATAEGTVLMVVGIAETDAVQARLHVAVAEGPGFAGGWLSSSSTRRAPYVQLSDLAPTAMKRLGRPVPEHVAGRPLSGGEPGRPDSLTETVRALSDTDTAAVEQRRARLGFFVGFGLVSLLVYGALSWLLRRRRRGGEVSEATMRRLGVAALALAAVPGCTFVANLVPWWRAPWPLLALSGVVLAAVAITVTVGLAGPWRRRIDGPVAAVSAVTVLIAAVDAVTGTTLQINSMLGYNPLVAGRFIGFGNIAAAAFGAAVMILTALLAYGRSRLAALGVVVALAVPAIALDGAPAWGADFGGVLTFVPAFVILALLVTRSRINVLRVVIAGAAGVVLVAVIGIVDYLQEPAPSHFGRFVASVLDGSAGATVYRKILTSLDLLLNGAHTVLAMVLVVLVAVLVFRPTVTLRDAYVAVPSLRVALVAVTVMSAIGFATNDSGVAIPVVAGLVAVPAAYALCVRASASLTTDSSEQTPTGAPRSEPSAPSSAPSMSSDTSIPGVTERAEVLP